MKYLRPAANALQVPFSTSEMQSFAFDFNTANSDRSASIEFGNIDHSVYEGRLTRAPLNNTGGHWSVDNVDFTVGNVRITAAIQLVLGAYRSIGKDSHSDHLFRSSQTQAQGTI